MEKINIKTVKEEAYSIYIERGMLSNLGGYLIKLTEKKSRVVVITNPLVKALYGVTLCSALKEGEFEVVFIEVPDGERYKSLSTANHLYDELIKRKADRHTLLVALGGGVIGDLTGFVAATYMRGLPLVHIPTTLLAQIDSSVGGKVAVDHHLAKNMIGSFYHPRAVFTDPEVLSTLSDKDLKNGIVEAVKIAVISSPAFFEWLEENLSRLLEKDRDLLSELIKEAVNLKVDIVLEDPREKGLRRLLNFGHSIGHALEAEVGYQTLSHGEAVALGMLVESRIARQRGQCSEELETKIRQILSFLYTSLPLPSSSSSSLSKEESIFEYIKNIDYYSFWETLTLDKKNYQGRMTFILPQALGKVSPVEDITFEEVVKALEELKKE